MLDILLATHAALELNSMQRADLPEPVAHHQIRKSIAPLLRRKGTKQGIRNVDLIRKQPGKKGTNDD